jgi:GntR family transcriptional regulator/MocR family aminotransferase
VDLTWLLAAPAPNALPRQQLLYQRLRTAILSAHLPPGTRLPASRNLAAELGIARNTVLHAYEQLIAEGCLVANRHGTRVASLPVEPAKTDADTPLSHSLPGLSQRGHLALRAAADSVRDTLPFAPGVPDVGAFPFRAWRGCLDRAWRDATPRQLGYTTPGGEPLLRRALASYLSSARGFAVQPEQVVITAGTHGAFELCARLLADAGDTVWLENPGYPAARTAFTLAGLEPWPVAVDGDGLAPTPADWRKHCPRLIMVTPSHQYPTGAVMSLARRLELAADAHEHGAWLLEDDYDSEFRRAGPALPALYGLHPTAPVLYAGTFSKTLYPALRLGYLIVPRVLADTFVRATAEATRPGHGIEQTALADFIERGHYTTHLRRMRRRYAARQQALLAALAQHPGVEIAITGGDAGLHLTLWLPPGLDDRAVCAAAETLGLAVRPLSHYTHPPRACNGVLLGYGNIDVPHMDGAVRRLRLAMQRAADHNPQP